MDGQNENMASFGDPATEPIDLAQAFKMYNQANGKAAEQDVAGGDSDEPVDDGSVGGGLAGGDDNPQEDGDDASSAAEPAEQGGDDGIGGSPDVIQPVDFNARKQEILRDIQKDALNLVRKDFADNGITPCTIEELYKRDENTGRVTFKNPDDPTRDFTSRDEAQRWIDSFNKQIDMRFRQEVNKKQQELVVDRAPMLRLIEFAPKFNAIDQTTKDILDDIIEPYSVMNEAGEVIGFNIDLNAALAQAQRIANRFNKTDNIQAPDGKSSDQDQGKQGSRPAMNMPTGTGKGSDEVEPKNIGEALKMFDKSNREKGKR